ncbi:MAG: PAS domain-containing protein, partial [Verrucomicrobiota bacterium]
LRADISGALVSGKTLPVVLQKCAEAVVNHLDAAFARIWTLKETENILELQASAGIYTHLNGPHGRVKVGEFKIGRIAQSAQPLLTNDVQHDSNISDPKWAKREGMVAFAGYPITLEGRVLGVMGLFARHTLSETVLSELAPITDGIAQWIQRKRAEGDLRESEEGFRSLVSIITDVPWTTDAQGAFVVPQLAWEKFTGQSWEEHRDFGWTNAVHPDEREAVKEIWEAAKQARSLYESRARLWHAPSQQYRHFVARATPLFDTNGDVRAWVGTCTDCHDAKAAEEKLRESEERFRNMADNIPQLAWIADAGTEGKASWFNKVWLDYTGTTIEQMQGSGWKSVHHPDYVERVAAKFEHYVKECLDWEDTFPLRGKDGQYRWFLSRMKVIRDESGKAVRIFGTNTDMTELREAQKQLSEHAEVLERTVAERTADLKETNEQLEAYVYSIAHDLRAPLRSMQGFSQVLIDDYATSLDETARNFLERINHSSEFMDKMIMDLLSFGRAGRAEIELKPVSVPSAWDAALFQCNKQIEQTDSQIETVLPLPSVRANEATLTQIFANLLSNGMKFVPADTQPKIRFWAEDCGPSVRFCLKDNGVGIPPDQHERVFRVFERLNGARFPGTGIGLSIVRKGVERMDGKVGLESAPGKGSKFWIELQKA